MKLGELRSRYRERAVEERISPRDIDLLLADAAGRAVSYVLAFDDAELTAVQAERFQEMAERRFRGEPLQYIRGWTEFYGRNFAVDDRVLIPRPETELVVEEAIRRAPQGGRVIDVCCGSGCIVISLKLERPDLTIFATDLSLGACAVTRANARALRANITGCAGDVLSHIRGRFDVIVSNPPYIPAGQLDSLQREVRGFEPHMALSPGRRGTELIELLFRQGLDLVAEGGLLIFEIGFSQGDEVRAAAAATGWEVQEIVSDLAAIPRVVVSSPAKKR